MQLKIQRSPLALAVVMALTATVVNAAVPDNSPFKTDPVEKYVYDQSVEALENANMILCDFSQIKAESFINKGSFVALVDGKKCRNDDSSVPERVTVDVSQENGASPVVVKGWVEESESGLTMPVKITITETPSASNPLGRFRMDWGTGGFKGFLQSVVDSQGRNVLQLFDQDVLVDEAGNSRFGIRNVSLLKTGESTGLGYVSVTDGGESRTYQLAFNASHFLRRNGGGVDTCLDRNNVDVSVWSYGLYDSTNGERVATESGFPVVVSGYYGWAGHWGVWLPPEQSFTDGMIVQKVNSDGSPGDAYTVHRQDGHLVLKDQSGNIHNFSPPLQVKYTDSEGREFHLSYDGFGQLHGIPGRCVSVETNQDTQCGPDTRWIPEFNIADGATVYDEADSSKAYLVKQLRMEQRMRPAASGACASLATEALPLPDDSSWQDPNIGDPPVVSAPPKVIGGVIQTTD